MLILSKAANPANAHGVQIIIVTSLRGRCRFVESLGGTTLNIFIENERIRFTSAL